MPHRRGNGMTRQWQPSALLTRGGRPGVVHPRAPLVVDGSLLDRSPNVTETVLQITAIEQSCDGGTRRVESGARATTYSTR